MQVTVIPPSAALAPFVARFTIIETAHEAATRTLLPELGVMLALRFAGGASLVVDGAATRTPDAAITGVLRSARHMHTDAHSGVVVAQFQPGGASACFAVPMHELAGATVGLDAVVARAAVAEVEQRLGGAADHAQRVAIVEQFLLARLAPERTDPLALAAVATLRTVGGQLRIPELARALGISQDPLEKRFRRAVGASPKHLASLIRLTAAIAERRRGGPADWSRRVIAAGYYDQSHFIREFRAVVGEAPEKFFRAGQYC